MKQQMQDKQTSANIKQPVNNSITQTAINIKYDKEMQVNFEGSLQNEVRNQSDVEQYQHKLNEKESIIKQLQNKVNQG